jgi:hypothetical protein
LLFWIFFWLFSILQTAFASLHHKPARQCTISTHQLIRLARVHFLSCFIQKDGVWWW